MFIIVYKIIAFTFLPNRFSLFLAGKNNSAVRKAKGIGKHFGLHLKMSVEQHEYIGHLAFSAGLRVRIHDPDEPPLVSSLGFAVMPGSHVFASITKQRVSMKCSTGSQKVYLPPHQKRLFGHSQPIHQ